MTNRQLSLRWQSLAQQCHHASAGFTLIEALIVIAIAGILVTISAPVWLGLLSSHNLSAAQNQTQQLILLAQSKADQTRVEWQVSFRTVNGRVEAATHPANGGASIWEPLPTGTQIDATETTFALSNGVYQMQFTQSGRVNGQLGRITFASASGGSARRCVIVSTLLGTLRKGQNQVTADAGGRYCY